MRCWTHSGDECHGAPCLQVRPAPEWRIEVAIRLLKPGLVAEEEGSVALQRCPVGRHVVHGNKGHSGVLAERQGQPYGQLALRPINEDRGAALGPLVQELRQQGLAIPPNDLNVCAVAQALCCRLTDLLGGEEVYGEDLLGKEAPDLRGEAAVDTRLQDQVHLVQLAEGHESKRFTEKYAVLSDPQVVDATLHEVADEGLKHEAVVASQGLAAHSDCGSVVWAINPPLCWLPLGDIDPLQVHKPYDRGNSGEPVLLPCRRRQGKLHAAVEVMMKMLYYLQRQRVTLCSIQRRERVRQHCDRALRTVADAAPEVGRGMLGKERPLLAPEPLSLVNTAAATLEEL
mmetsp:Transcript_28056/g.63546  ORF Transcript_28056/g.63546 Transcript_28056/m.63546 type:complete len:343 (-) Transcript_28056:230-1258(-)